MQPLSHHEIFGLVAPFSRRGLAVDLAASARAERRLSFKATQHASGLIDQLELAHPAPDDFRLTRRLLHPRGLTAMLVAEGREPAALLEQVLAVEPAAMFREGADHLVAFHHRLGADGPRLTQGEALAAGLRLTLTLPMVAGYAGESRLTAPAGQALSLPDDLLAIADRDWDRLARDSRGWHGAYAARGKEPQRSRRAEAALLRAAQHLAETLAAPPAAYHARHAGARWRFALRRTLPLGVIVGLVAGSAAVPSLGLAQDSTWRMLIFNAPPILVAVGLCLRELPRFEWPRWPRALPQAAWAQPLAVAQGTADTRLAPTGSDPR